MYLSVSHIRHIIVWRYRYSNAIRGELHTLQRYKYSNPIYFFNAPFNYGLKTNVPRVCYKMHANICTNYYRFLTSCIFIVVDLPQTYVMQRIITKQNTVTAIIHRNRERGYKHGKLIFGVLHFNNVTLTRSYEKYAKTVTNNVGVLTNNLLGVIMIG